MPDWFFYIVIGIASFIVGYAFGHNGGYAQASEYYLECLRRGEEP